MEHLFSYVSANSNMLIVIISISFASAALANYIHVKYFKKKD